MLIVTKNERPYAGILTYERPHGATGPFTINAPGGLAANTFDDDHDPLTFRLAAPPRHGTLVVRPDGSFTYTPTTPGGRVVSDGFSYVANDGFEDSDPIGVGIRVQNAAPVSQGGTIALDHGHMFNPAPRRSRTPTPTATRWKSSARTTRGSAQ